MLIALAVFSHVQRQFHALAEIFLIENEANMTFYCSPQRATLRR